MSLVDGDVGTELAEAWEESLGRLARVTDGSAVKSPTGVLSLKTGVPVPNLKGVLSLTGHPSQADLLAAVTAFEAAGLWSVTSREPLSEQVRSAAAGRGLTTVISHPLLVRPVLELDKSLWPAAGMSVRKADPEGDLVYAEVVAAGFEAPASFVTPFGSAAVLGEPNIDGFVVEKDGNAVAAAMGVRSGRAMAVVNVAVPPQYRRQGFGELATQAVLAHAAKTGSKLAYLHATPMGLPLYERLGFVITEQWTMILPAAS